MIDTPDVRMSHMVQADGGQVVPAAAGGHGGGGVLQQQQLAEVGNPVALAAPKRHDCSCTAYGTVW